MTLAVARAGLEAVADADRLIREAADWLAAKGEPLWGPEEISYDDLVAVARKGELVLGRVDGETAACLYLHDEDTLFWPEANPGEAFYVHRLAVARKFAGRGLAHAMLEWAEEEARAMGRAFLRLDCVPRPKLVALYQSAGFVPVDPGPVMVGRHLVIRQQKPV